jgi:hypothetical protein
MQIKIRGIPGPYFASSKMCFGRGKKADFFIAAAQPDR